MEAKDAMSHQHHNATMFGNARRAMTRITAVGIAVAAASVSVGAKACALEPTVRGGFSVSYPGSLEVAVAVAKARAAGVLAQPGKTAQSNEAQLHQILLGLQHLQNRLSKGRSETPYSDSAPFSLVLVGPGLWSHFHITPGGVLAKYHVRGPIPDSAVVLTHSTVIEALVTGGLTAERAEGLGLLRYTGANAQYIKQVFEQGLQS